MLLMDAEEEASPRTPSLDGIGGCKCFVGGALEGSLLSFQGVVRGMLAASRWALSISLTIVSIETMFDTCGKKSE